MKYECTETRLSNEGAAPNSLLQGFGEQELNGFGTADDSDYHGCACGVLGTCKVAGVTCNCDGRGSMVDQGFVTDRNLLPITGFNAFYDSPNSEGVLRITDVRCGPAPIGKVQRVLLASSPSCLCLLVGWPSCLCLLVGWPSCSCWLVGWFFVVVVRF